MLSIDSITPTLCYLMNVPLPSDASAKPLESVLEATRLKLSNKMVSKCFIYLPDAIGEKMYQDYKDDFKPVVKLAPIQIEINSIYPSFTPVCFASMFSGAKPDVHGIKKYEKPVVKIDTLFDSLIREGKKVAIVAVKECSMDLIFRNRDIDYYSERYDLEVRQRVLNIIDKKDYDFIVAYQQEYDDKMHETTPQSIESMEAFRRLIEGFRVLASAFLKRYENENKIVGFFPDHGAHVSPETGKGGHGTDSVEDIKLRHFWGVYKSLS